MIGHLKKIQLLVSFSLLLLMFVGCVEPSNTATSTPTPTSTPAPTFQKTYILIRGVMAIGGDGEPIDGRKNAPGNISPRLEVVVNSGNKATGLDIVEWSKQVEELGAGEILLTSKDADGTKEGYDLEMTRAVAEAVSIPVTASDGAGKLEHLYDAIVIGKASAVLAASIFHFREISTLQAKQYLKSKGISVIL